MRFWTREAAGWILLGLSLYVFYRDYQLLTSDNHWIVEGGMLTLIGIFLLRGGIQLLKIAVAAEICMETQQRMERGSGKAGERFASRALVGRRPAVHPER